MSGLGRGSSYLLLDHRGGGGHSVGRGGGGVQGGGCHSVEVHPGISRGGFEEFYTTFLRPISFHAKRLFHTSQWKIVSNQIVRE